MNFKEILFSCFLDQSNNDNTWWQRKIENFGLNVKNQVIRFMGWITAEDFLVALQ